MKKLLIIILLAIPLWGLSQDYKRTQNWYFGDSAGLSFATDPPTVLTDGVMKAGEGCSTISDTVGNLLFYTNGVTVWNKNHQIMENGTGLNGHISSTQSSLIIPYPQNDSLFYIFTTDAVGQFNGLQYSLVNINKNGGLGSVIVKNILLQTPVCEKLTATYHQNGRDIWVLSHKWNSNEYISYLITKEGLINCPIIYPIGSNHNGLIANSQGEMKFSNNGKKVAVALYVSQFIEVLDFDKVSGRLSNPIKLDSIFLPYGLSFSNNNSLLYVTDRGKNLYQYNLDYNNIGEIRNNRKTIFNYSTKEIFGALNIGINRKLYVSIFDSSYISLIHRPDSISDSCLFKLEGISFNKGKSQYGLPNFITSYFYTPKLDFTYITNCETDSINFVAKGGSSHTWQIFRNKAIIYTIAQPTMGFNFTDTGEYIIQLVSGSDTATKTIYIEPKLTLGQDTILCNQNSYSLLLPSNHRCISWQDGADSTRYTLTQSGTYSVGAYNIRGCLVSDTVKIIFTNLDAPIITKSNDSLFTDSGYKSYNWYYNTAPITSNTHTVKVTKNGNYRVEITDSNGCTNTSANFLVSGLGINLLDAEDYFEIYPIPTNNTLFIENKHNITLQSIRVKDIAGRIFNYTPNTILSLEALAKGIYYLELVDTENNHFTTKILIN